MARWEDALNEKVRLSQWWLTDRGRDYAATFAADVAAKGRPGVAAYRGIAEVEAEKLMGADPVWVSDEVMDLVEAAAAAPSFRFEPFYSEDLITERGFALLPRAWTAEDVNGDTVSFRAVSWGPTMTAGYDGPEPALHVTLYTDDRDDGSHLGMDASWRRYFGGRLSMFHSAVHAWGETPTDLLAGLEDGDYDVPAEAIRRSVHDLWRFLQAFFRLAAQRIVVRERTRGDRKSRRRMARVDPDNDGVLVIRLRRPENPKPGSPESEVEWSRRWIVGGHWRNQWYPSLGDHHQIWIAPFVKGPDDKPLVLHPDRVYEFVR